MDASHHFGTLRPRDSPPESAFVEKTATDSILYFIKCKVKNYRDARGCLIGENKLQLTTNKTLTLFFPRLREHSKARWGSMLGSTDGSPTPASKA